MNQTFTKAAKVAVMRRDDNATNTTLRTTATKPESGASASSSSK